MGVPVTGDGPLVAAARDGDDDAYARLFDRHAPVVMSFCRRGLGSAAEAEDALQETFIRAHDRLGQLDDGDRFRPWLYAIARHVCSERRRALLRRRKHEAAAMTTASRAREDGAASGGAPCAARSEALDRLSRSIDRLGDRERLAIHLYYLDADPVRAAAEALGVSRSGYYKLLARARAQLAALLGEMQPS
jgi:RNA polymerase sigma-70 factor (ECF subfamily)